MVCSVILHVTPQHKKKIIAKELTVMNVMFNDFSV